MLFIIFSTLDWINHIAMVRHSKEQYGWASYRKFAEQFKKVDWIYKKERKGSLFSRTYGTDEFHASVIAFNNRGMIINNPISYLLVKRYVKKYIKRNDLEKKKSRKIKEWR